MTIKTVHPVSFSAARELKIPEIDFKYNVTLNLSLDASKKVVKAILANFGEGLNTIKLINHLTLSDHSESDMWAHYGTYGNEKLLLRIEHKWIDPHFLSFWLWENEKTDIYDIDHLFTELIMDEAWQSGNKFGEILVAPCKIVINTVENDPKLIIPVEGIINKMTIEGANGVGVRFWQFFQSQNYENAAMILSEARKRWRKKDTEYDFLSALESLCYFNGEKYEQAVESFVTVARDFDTKFLPMNSNLCLFFAIEAAKRMEFPTQSICAMEQIAQKIPKLSSYHRQEILAVLKTYSVSVYIGSVVLCRRIMEIALKDALTQRYGETISSLVNQCKKAGQLDGRIGQGLYQTLQVAKWKKVISPVDYDIALAVKEYGDRIHVKDGLRNAIHAKYAIQAFIRILRQLDSELKTK